MIKPNSSTHKLARHPVFLHVAAVQHWPKLGRLTAQLALLFVLAACHNESGSEPDALTKVQASTTDSTNLPTGKTEVFTDAAGNLGDTEFLPVDEAFRIDIAAGEQGTELIWIVAADYYLYKHKFVILANFEDQSEPQDITASTRFSPGLRKTDDYFGNVEVFYHQAVATIPPIPASNPPTSLTVQYQGCADAGLCYPVQTRTLAIN